MTLTIGDILDEKYRIVRLIGEGGMGSVYEGENLRIHRRVAIKVLHANVAESEDAVQRFEREAQAAGRIGSEHIVEVLDLGELPDGDRYMVMEYLEGQALNERILTRGRVNPHNAARMAIQLLEGLKAAHAAGIIHRDLKPDNVFLLSSRRGRNDFVKILDFGISKFNTVGGEFSMTRTGAVMGTPYYLSPEQAKGERNVDQRSDLYAVGVILWEACAGHVPYDGATFNELLFKIVLEPIPALSRAVPTIDPQFAQIVEKAMSRDPADRFQSAQEMQESLKQWLDEQPASAATERPPETVDLPNPAIPAHTPHGFAPDSGQRGTPPIEHRTQAIGTPQAAAAGVTGGNWTMSTGAHAGQRGKVIVAALLIALLGGGGGYYLVSAQQAEEARKTAAHAAEEAKKREAEEARKAELARLEADKARAEAEKAEAARARSEADRVKAQSHLAAAARAAEEERRRKEAEEEEERKRRTQWAAPRPAPAPTPEPKPAPTPQPTGRKIRTSL